MPELFFVQVIAYEVKTESKEENKEKYYCRKGKKHFVQEFEIKKYKYLSEEGVGEERNICID